MPVRSASASSDHLRSARRRARRRAMRRSMSTSAAADSAMAFGISYKRHYLLLEMAARGVARPRARGKSSRLCQAVNRRPDEYTGRRAAPQRPHSASIAKKSTNSSSARSARPRRSSIWRAGFRSKSGAPGGGRSGPLRRRLRPRAGRSAAPSALRRWRSADGCGSRAGRRLRTKTATSAKSKPAPGRRSGDAIPPHHRRR